MMTSANTTNIRVLDRIRQDSETLRRVLRIFAKNDNRMCLISVSVMCTALLSWGYHLLFARPEKEHEVEDLARDAARTVLENYATERASLKLQEIRAKVSLSV